MAANRAHHPATFAGKRSEKGESLLDEFDIQPRYTSTTRHHRSLPSRSVLGLFASLRPAKHSGQQVRSPPRTHLTALSEVGATAFETQEQAGHAKLDTTMSYVRRISYRVATLTYGGLWWARGDSNARPLPCQGSA